MKALLAGLVLVVFTLYPALAADPGGPVIGIGTELKSVDSHPVVSSLVPGSPAQKGGVKPGDRIVSIDGRSVDGLTLVQVGDLLHGAENSHVHVTLLRDGATKHFRLKREILVMPGSKLPDKP